MSSHFSCQWTGGRLLTPLGGIGVAMFLITSGYGLNESYKRNGLNGFWKKRLGRVYLPYLFVAIIFAVVRHWNVQQCLLNFSCINSPYWFITYIVGCYILFWSISMKLPKYRNCIFIVVSTLTLLYLPNLQAEQAFSFVSGIMFSAHKDRLFGGLYHKKTYYGICLLSGLIGISFLALKQFPVIRNSASDVQMNIIQLLIKYPLAVFVLLSLNAAKPILRNPFIYLAGLISYELYLVHYPFFVFIGDSLWPALVLFVVSFALAYPFYRINSWLHQKIIS